MSAELLQLRRERASALVESLAQETGIPVDCIMSRSHDPQVVAVRHRLWVMLHDSGLSIGAIGKVLGRDHTTILYGLRKALGAEYHARVQEQYGPARASSYRGNVGRVRVA